MKNTQTFTLNKKLILHFQIQNIIRLPNNNKDLYVYSKCSQWTWGKLQYNNKQKPQLVSGWKLAVNNLSIEQPEPQLITYKQYLDDYLKPINEQRQKLLFNFTKGAGSKVKGQIEKNIKNITVPKALVDSLKESNDNSFVVEKYLQDGKYLIIPAFYKLLLQLKKNKREFAIILHNRDANDDHKSIIGELNMFFNGQHPLYNGKNGTPLVRMDGSKGCKNFIINQNHQFLTTSFSDKYFAIYGTCQKGPEDHQEETFKLRYKNKNNIKICEGFNQIFAYSHTLLSESACQYGLDLQGLITLDQVDDLTQQIYFTNSDNIKVFSCLGESINPLKVGVRVQLLQLLRDVDFFIKKIQKAEQQMGDKGKKIQEQQIEREDNLSNSEFLKAKVLPVLEGALRQVDIFRPKDPISFIALYCLKHQERI